MSDLVAVWEVSLSDGLHLVEFEHGTTTGKRIIRVDGKMSNDLVAEWEVALGDGKHHIQFYHGTLTGKRVIVVDGKEIMRKDWMFKLVGREHFSLHKAKCCITIEAVSGFAYEYTLEVNGKNLQRFSENQSKVMKTWVAVIGGIDTRIVLEKDTLDIWVNGTKVPTTGEFVDDGTETHFTIGDTPAYIKAVSSGKRRAGIVHTLWIEDRLIPEAKE